MYSYGPPHMAVQKQDDQHEHTFSNYVRIRDVVQRTCLRWWMIGKGGERGSGISVLPARHDDDDDDICQPRNKCNESGTSNIYIPSYRSNIITIFLLHEWLWHYITHQGWYAVKQRNQTKPSPKVGQRDVKT